MENIRDILNNKGIQELETRVINGYKVVICEHKLDEVHREIQFARMKMQLEKCMVKD